MADAVAYRPKYLSQFLLGVTVSVGSGPQPADTPAPAKLRKRLVQRDDGISSGSPSGSTPPITITTSSENVQGGSSGINTSSFSPSDSLSISPPPPSNSQPSLSSSPTDSSPSPLPTSQSSTESPSSLSSPPSSSSSLSILPSSSSPPSSSPSLSTMSTSSFSADTTITSAVVYTVNGQVSTSFVAIPTILSNQDDGITASQRSAIIAGSVVGGTIFILLLVCIWFFYRRHQSKKRGFFQASEPRPRTMLLAGEDLYDDQGYSSFTGAPIPPVMRYSDIPASHGRSLSTDSGPRLMRPRASDSGSIFHEGVWPPPGERSKLVDPILAGSEINLSRIVDDVMGGPSDSVGGASRLRGGATRGSPDLSSHSTSSWTDGSPVGGIGKHNRDISATSETGLLAYPRPSHVSQSPNNVPASASASSLLPSRMQTNSNPSHSTTSVQSTLGSTTGPKNWLDRSPRKIKNDTSPARPYTHLPQAPTTPSPRAFTPIFP